MFPVSPLEAVAVSAIVVIGASIQGSIGFGWAMLAAPFIVLIEPDFVPAPMILSGLALTFLLTCRERKSIDIRGVRWMAVGCIPGIAAASVILTMISATGFTILFSILVLIAVGLSAMGFSVTLSRRNVLIAGILSGFMGTTSSIGGPPVAMIYQNSPGARLRGTLSAYFFICGALALIGLFAVGWLGSDELRLAIVLLPGLIFGFIISRFTAGILDRYSMRPAVLLLSGFAAIVILVRSLV